MLGAFSCKCQTRIDPPWAATHAFYRFDIFLDGSYPSSPPKMAFVLNGNDSEEWSFNPNLHKNTGTGMLFCLLPGPDQIWISLLHSELMLIVDYSLSIHHQHLARISCGNVATRQKYNSRRSYLHPSNDSWRTYTLDQ